ncbi:MAG: hypothetical protein ACRCWY_11290 [Cellulosilyticaceae bacterium]
MLPYKMMYITENHLTVEKRWKHKVWHKWQVEMPVGVVSNGYCENASYLKKLLSTYGQRYGGWLLPVYLYCESTDRVRWHRQLPQMKRWERERILKNHQKELIPVQAEDYTLYYEAGSCVDGEQVVYLLGTPKALEGSYKDVFAGQPWIKIWYGCEVERRCQEAFSLLKKDCLVAYQQGEKIYVAISREGHAVVCRCATLSTRDDVEAQKEEALMEVMKLMYFYSQHNPTQRLKYLVMESVQQKTVEGIQVKGMTLASLAGEVEDELGLQVVSLPEIPMKKPKIMNQLRKKENLRTAMKRLGVSAAIVVGGIIGIDGWQVLEKQYALNRYKEQLTQPIYQEVQRQKEEKLALEMQVEKLRAMEAMIEGPSQYAAQTLMQIENQPIIQEQRIGYYRIQAEDRQVVVEGHTPSAAEFLKGVRSIEKQWENQKISCQFEEANLWQPTAFALHIANEEKNSEAD